MPINAAILKAIRENSSTLVELTLTDLYDEDVRCLKEALTGNSSVKQIYIGGHHLTGESYPHLLALLESNTSIVKLGFELITPIKTEHAMWNGAITEVLEERRLQLASASNQKPQPTLVSAFEKQQNSGFEEKQKLISGTVKQPPQSKGPRLIKGF